MLYNNNLSRYQILTMDSIQFITCFVQAKDVNEVLIIYELLNVNGCQEKIQSFYS